MGAYRKKSVLVEAARFNGSSTSAASIRHWIDHGGDYVAPGVTTCDMTSFQIVTLEGAMTVSPGDFVIRGVAGEHYPCKPDIFAQTYDAAPR